MIEACIVNHNCSQFSELALRSLLATNGGVDLRVTVLDNHSADPGIEALREAANALGATVTLSRWPAAASSVNSHGDVLRDFIRGRPEAELFLFVDADVVFIHPDAVATMRAELLTDPRVWAVQARFEWAEDELGPGASLDVSAGTPVEVRTDIRMGPATFDNRFGGHFQARCHPGCTLVRASPTFRSVVEHVGLSPAIVISPDEESARIYDTLGLASTAMATHGLRYRLSSATVRHFFGVSYDRAQDIRSKVIECQQLLAAIRSSPPPIDGG